MTNFVQLYKSTDANAPVLTGENSKLIDLLDAILVNGYTTASVTSIVESGTNYTVTLAVANSTLVVGNYLLFAGGSPGGVNIAMMINAVTDSTHVVCTGPGGLGSITGTITYRKAPLAWTKPYTGTNKAVFRSADTGSNQFYLRVLDDGSVTSALQAMIRGYETMSDVDTGTGLFPTVAQLANGLYCRKSATANSTARAWTLIGDDRTFYLIVNTGDSDAAAWHEIGFGHFISFKSGDGFNTFIGGNPTTNSSNSPNGLTGSLPLGNISTANLYVARSYSQAGTALACALGGYSNTASINLIGIASVAGGSLLTYPNASDSGLYVQPFMVNESGLVRGRMPGMYGPLHQAPLTFYDLSTGIAGLPGATLIALSITYSGGKGQIMHDVFGPWT